MASAELGAADQSGWNGAITGSVVDARGNPIVGASVTSDNAFTSWSTKVQSRSTNAVGRGYAGPTDIEEGLARTAEARLRSRRDRRRVATASDGTFRLEGLRPGQHRLMIQAEGFVFGNEVHSVGDEVIAVGEPVAIFTLDVRLPDGSQPDLAIIGTGDDNRPTYYEWKPDAPELRMRERRVRFQVWAGDVERLDWRTVIAEFASPATALSLAADGQGPHEVLLEPAQLLRVTVDDASSSGPRIPAWMKIIPADGARPADKDWTRSEAQTVTRQETGRFAASGLAAGDYWLGVGRGASTPELVDRITLVEGTTRHRVALGELTRSDFLEVTCRTAEGLPVLGVKINAVTKAEGGGSSSGNSNGITRGPGVYWVTWSSIYRGYDPANVESVELTAKSKAFGDAGVELAPGSSAVEITFVEPADLELLVTGDLAGKYAAYLARAEAEGEVERMNPYFGGMRGMESVDAAGRALFSGKQPGAYVLHVFEGDGRHGRATPLITEDVVLRPGSNAMTVALPTLHDVALHAPKGREGQRFWMRRDDSDGSGAPRTDRNGRLGEDLRCTFEGVPAGRYLVGTWGRSGNQQMTVDVPGGEVVWDPQEPDCLRASPVTAGSAAHEAGLRDGDLVIAIDGKDVDARRGVSVLPIRLMNETLQLTVVRDGRTLNVTAGPFGERNGGVRFSPHTR